MQASPRLVVIEGKDKGKVIPLKDGTLVVGRSKGDVIVQDPRVSRSHITITFDEKTGKVSFSDLKSLNGTQLNGAAATSGDLNDGDKLQVGNTTFDCQIGPPTESSEISFALPDSARTDSVRREPDAMPMDAASEADEEKTPPPKSTKKKSKKRAEPEAEPDFSPDAELNFEAEMNDEPVGASAKEPIPEPDSKPTKKKKAKDKGSRKERLTSLKAAYLRLPTKARNAGLVVLLLVGLVAVFGKSTKTGTVSIDKELAQVRKLQSQGKLSEAVAMANELKTKFPENAKLQITLGDLFTQQGKNDLAVAAYLKGHDLKPAEPLIHTRVLATYLRAGMQQEALAELEHVEGQIKSDPPRDVIIEVAQLFLEFKELKQPPEKTLILARALQNDKAPDSTVGYRLEAQTLFQMNRPQDAIVVMEKGLKIGPTDDWLLENIVFARLEIKDVPGAAAMAENWIRLKPTATKAMLVMAYLKYNGKAYAEALPYLQKIVEVAATMPTEPHHPEALSLIGQVYQQLNQKDQAITYYKKACEADFKQACDNELLKTAAAAPSVDPSASSAPPAPASLPGSTPEVVIEPSTAPVAPPPAVAPAPGAAIKGAGAPKP